ncbi:hypothetical protein CPCC7001_801 [Cyanobium sp. PCC 7001]|nr:hypothetical protein CPCC7001_801 [Cyanobium sp. PCC 7001]
MTTSPLPIDWQESSERLLQHKDPEFRAVAGLMQEWLA